MRNGLLVVVLVLSLGLAVVLPPSADAAPATPVRYPAGAAATQFSGLAFDTCTAPSVDTMKAWRSSPYRAVGVYIGGPTRACSQRHLTAAWVSVVSAMQWRLVPIYTGLQSHCRRHAKKYRISPSRAVAQGASSATHAVSKARALGLLPGSALYLDIETYPESKDPCRIAVLRYVSGWTRQLHRHGYLSGVYAALYSGGRHLAQAYRSNAYARPDAVWIAHWNKKDTLKNWKGVPDEHWAAGQRGKQFRGPHHEKHGGRKLAIDSNRFHAPVATVAHRYRVTSGVPLKARTGPSTKRKIVGRHPPGSTVRVVCQTRGAKVGGTRVWNKLSGGAFVSNRFVSTPSKKRFSAPLPRCSFPFQVTAPQGLNQRTGPGASHRVAGRLPPGSLVRVVCQRTGTRILGTRVWNRLHNGRWVSDHYVATPSRKGFSRPIPRC